MNEDELIESFAEFYAYVDQEVRPTLPTIICIQDTNHRGYWTPDASYEVNDGVQHGDVFFVAVAPNHKANPSFSGSWVLLTQQEKQEEALWEPLSADFKFESLEPTAWQKDAMERISRLAAERVVFQAIQHPKSLRIGSVS